MGIKEIACGRSDLYSLDPSLIQDKEEFDVRIDCEDLREHICDLAQSIAMIGVQTPLTIYMENDIPFIIDGRCRLAAVKLANERYNAEIKAVPVRMDNKNNNDADRTLGLLTRNGGRPLTLLEQSDVVIKLMNHTWDEERIAQFAGKSISHIKNLVMLGTVSDNVRQMIIDGTVSASNVIEAVRKFGAKAEGALLEAIDMVEEQGKKKVTQKQLPVKSKKGIDWKVEGPRCRDMLELICFSSHSPDVIEANINDAKLLLEEIKSR